jgi:hypothetical protein
MEPPQSFSYSELKEMVHEIQDKLSSTDRPVWKMRGDPNTLIPAVDRAGVMQACHGTYFQAQDGCFVFH